MAINAEARVTKAISYSMAALLIGAATSAVAQDPGNAEKGRAFAQRVCAECHAVGPTSVRTPLASVASFKEIANSPGMTEIALSVWLRTPHKTNMPNLVLEPNDRDDVIAYIVSLRDR
jgi:cytochrome c2